MKKWMTQVLIVLLTFFFSRDAFAEMDQLTGYAIPSNSNIGLLSNIMVGPFNSALTQGSTGMNFAVSGPQMSLQNLCFFGQYFISNYIDPKHFHFTFKGVDSSLPQMQAFVTPDQNGAGWMGNNLQITLGASLGKAAPNSILNLMRRQSGAFSAVFIHATGDLEVDPLNEDELGNNGNFYGGNMHR